MAAVALLAEGVDRNITLITSSQPSAWSPSSRRAWIEIARKLCKMQKCAVALLAEGVDRNIS